MTELTYAKFLVALGHQQIQADYNGRQNLIEISLDINDFRYNFADQTPFFKISGKIPQEIIELPEFLLLFQVKSSTSGVTSRGSMLISTDSSRWGLSSYSMPSNTAEVCWILFNSCRTEFIFRNMKIYLHFLLFLNTEMAQIFEILPMEDKHTFILTLYVQKFSMGT